MSIKSRLRLLLQQRVWAALGIVFSVLGVGLSWYTLQGPTVGRTQQLGDVGQEPLHPIPCELSTVLGKLRSALREGSPASQRYLREMVAQVAAASSFDDLRSLFARERDPGALEVLAQAMVSRSHALGHIGEPTELRPLLDRLATEPDPILRAAMVRPLGATIEPVSGLYVRLIQDLAPEVREAVVANILAEQRIGYGHIREIAERAIAVAVAARSVAPEAGARILENVDIKTASTAFVDQVLNLLQANNPRLRAGTAVALGTVGASEARRVTQVLVVRYQTESDRGVRKSILQGIVHLGFADAVLTLESLRGIDSTLIAEIDLWLTALQLNRQEWTTLLREKERLTKAKGI